MLPILVLGIGFIFDATIPCSGSIPHPRLMYSVHYCPATSDIATREHKDQTALRTPLVEGGGMPTESTNHLILA